MAKEVTKFTVRIPSHIGKALEEKAGEELISKNALIVRACKDLIRCLDAKHKPEVRNDAQTNNAPTI